MPDIFLFEEKLNGRQSVLSFFSVETVYSDYFFESARIRFFVDELSVRKRISEFSDARVKQPVENWKLV